MSVDCHVQKNKTKFIESSLNDLRSRALLMIVLILWCFSFCRRNLSRAVTLLELIKRREKTKREHVHLGIEIFEKRYQAKDFNGYLLNEYQNNAVKNSRFATVFY